MNIKSYSQANQDIFVLACLKEKRNGFFLDLGCNHPINISNSYLLESQFDWSGIAIDIDQNNIKKFKDLRKCQAVHADCTKIDYENLLQNIDHIDYLSLDLEPASVTFECLKRLPFDKMHFSVITYEHDSYRFGNCFRDMSRDIIQSWGYYLLCEDVCDHDFAYEDWYVKPDYVDLESVMHFKSVGLNHSDIISRKL